MAKLVPDPRTSIPAAEAAPTDTTARPLEKAADLADRHGQVTRRAVLLQYDADTADPTADDYDDRTITAARAALAAGRFEAARRLASRVLLRAGEGGGELLVAALRGRVDDGVVAAARSIEAEARDGLRSTNYARERSARLFANEWAVKLRGVIEAGGAEALELFLAGVPDKAKIAEQARMPVRREGELCALDLVNFVLMHLGGGVGVTLIAGEKGVVQTAFTPHAPGPSVGHDLEALAARLEEAGGAAPCPMCGAPRWTFVADEQGEACSVCSWPHAPGRAPIVRRQLAAEEARAALREREAQVAALEKQVATLEGVKTSLEGKVAKYDAEVRRMRAAPKPPAEEAAEIIAKGRALIADLEAMIVAKRQDDAATDAEVG